VTYARGGLAQALHLPRCPPNRYRRKVSFRRGAAEGGVYETESTLLIGVIGVVLGMSTISAQGQIIGQLEADIPFTFHAGGAKLPPGKYIIHVLEDSDLGQMEIQSADGRTSALFEVREAQDSTSPKKGELVFNHYGNRYFLSKVFDEGEKVGSAVVESGYAKQYASRGASDGEKDVPASRPGS
jgi:hypothetical protein